MPLIRISVLVSGGGSNLQSIMDAIDNGTIDGEVAAVISDKKNAYALERARINGIPAFYIDQRQYSAKGEFNAAIKEILDRYHPDLIVLAGFLSILDKSFVQSYPNRIMNIHPSLIPSFCGKGFYGERVHNAVLQCGVKVTGATVHFVDEGTDTGPIILQKCVPVLQDDDAHSLSSRVLKVEHQILPEAVKLFAEGRLQVNGKKVYITDM